MAKKTTSEVSARAASILKKPYSRVIVPEQDGSFRAEIIEFPGCLATGESAAAALAALESVAHSWLTSVLERGQNVPEPAETTTYSGSLVVK